MRGKSNNLKTTFQAFIYSSSIFGACMGIFILIESRNILYGFLGALMAGIPFGVIMSSYQFFILVLFDKKIFFYSLMPKRLHEHGVKKIYYESIAGNATGARIKHGGLFLTENTVLFIPQRFALTKSLTEIHLKDIKHIKETGLNFFKWFSGGLKGRLFIETNRGECYEFSVWNIDIWIKKIRDRKEIKAE